MWEDVMVGAGTTTNHDFNFGGVINLLISISQEKIDQSPELYVNKKGW